MGDPDTQRGESGVGVVAPTSRNIGEKRGTQCLVFNQVVRGVKSVMSVGVVVGELMAVADVGSLWAEAERWGPVVTGKRRGEIAEAAFLAKVASLGFTVSKTWGDSDRYDFVVDGGAGLRRVQVKSAHCEGEDGGYSFRTHDHGFRAYCAEDIDALVAYVVPKDAWYVFPVKVFRRLRSLKLFPETKKKRSKFEKYREGWESLRR